MQRSSSIARFVALTAVAHIGLGASFSLAGKISPENKDEKVPPVFGPLDPGPKDDPQPEICPPKRLEYVEADVFARLSVRESIPFLPTDVSTVVLTNNGALPVRVTIDYYNELCLCDNPQSTDPNFRKQDGAMGFGPFPCERMERKVSELNPGEQSTTITNFSPGFFLETGSQMVAYRVLVEYDANYEDLAQKPSTVAARERVEVYADFYRNLKIVDCAVDGGIPKFTFEERSQAAIQSTIFTNDPTINSNSDDEPPNFSGFHEVRPTTKGISEACLVPPTQLPTDSMYLDGAARSSDIPSLVKIIPPEPYGVTQPINSAGQIARSLTGKDVF